MRRPVNAQRMAEGAIAVIACSALLGAAAGWALVYGIRAAARGLWKRAMRHVYRQAMHQAAVDAGLTPALASRTGPWEPAPEPDTPAPWWASTDTADLTLVDDGTPIRGRA